MTRGFYWEAGNTLRAKWWQLLLARWFGKRMTGVDGDTIVTMYAWRGTLYFWNCTTRGE